MSSFRHWIALLLVILSAASGGAGIFTQATSVDLYFSHLAYWFASIWTMLISFHMRVGKTSLD